MVSRRFFFCHLQKTAGTSLIRRLQAHFSEAQVYPNRHDGDVVDRVISVRHLLARWQVRGPEIALLTGHFPLCTRDLLGGDFATFTILREPVARTLSYLRHHRRLTPADRDQSLDALYDDKFRFRGLIHNHMVKMLALRVEEMTAGALTPVTFTRDHLARAQAQLATIDVVGVQERFDDFCADLHDRFGFALGTPVHVNRTEPIAVSPALRDRIACDNALDIELYESARALVAERHRGPRTRLASA
jgi:hypothetical protein